MKLNGLIFVATVGVIAGLKVYGDFKYKEGLIDGVINYNKYECEQKRNQKKGSNWPLLLVFMRYHHKKPIPRKNWETYFDRKYI